MLLSCYVVTEGKLYDWRHINPLMLMIFFFINLKCLRNKGMAITQETTEILQNPNIILQKMGCTVLSKYVGFVF